GGGGGGVVGWRAARQTRAAAAVRAAVADAEGWQGEGRWREAEAAARRAEALLADGEGGEDLRQRALELLADVRMVARLEAVRLLRSGVRDGYFDSAGADRGYAAAFRD